MGTQPPLLPGPGAQPCTARKRPRGGQLSGAQQTETWNIFIASDSPAIKVPGARASRYRVYGVIGLHIGNYPKKKNYPKNYDKALFLPEARVTGLILNDIRKTRGAGN